MKYRIECTFYCRFNWLILIYLVMGNRQSQQQPKQFEVEINHPRFSKSKIITKDNDKFLQTSQSIDQKEYDKWKVAIEKYKNSPASNLLLPKAHSFSRAGLCGNTGTLVINYENYPYLLIEEIYNRKGLKSKFSQTEIWFLLYSLIEARKQASAVGEKLGDVRPKNIFLNEEGNIKVSNSLAWPLQITNIQKSFDKTATYLAPQDLIKIEKGENFESPSELSEAFSIGLSTLSAGNLTEYEDLYDLKANAININKFNEALGIWAYNSSFSEVLRGTVLLLLNLNPERRFSCVQLNELLNKHEEHIVKKQNFVVDNAPPKLHEEIQHLRAMLTHQNGTIPIHGVSSPLITSQYKLDLKIHQQIGEMKK